MADVTAITSFCRRCAYIPSSSKVICVADRTTPDNEEECGMSAVESFRSKAEAYLEKARKVSDRSRARLLLVQAHNYLRCAEETEAEQLSAR